MHLQSLREPLELFEACADLNASGISWSYEHAVHIIKLLSNGEGFFLLFFFSFPPAFTNRVSNKGKPSHVQCKTAIRHGQMHLPKLYTSNNKTDGNLLLFHY